MSTQTESSLTRETLLSLQEVTRRLPSYRRGRPMSVSAVMRWIQRGVRAPHGRIRLEAIRIGGRWLTSVEALERFAARQTPALEDAPQLPRTPTARRRASDRAEAQLQKLGI